MEDKLYIVTCDCACKLEIAIYAQNQEEAEEYAKEYNKRFDDAEMKDIEIIDILKVEEE